MQYRVYKFLANSANLALLWLTWKLVAGQLDWGLSVGSLLVSTFWLVFTGLRLRQLLATYADVFSRMQILVPLCTGLVLSVIAGLAVRAPILQVAAAALGVAWVGVYVLYRRTRSNYMKQGHGPLPADCWVNPDPDALQPFDLLLFNGAMAGKIHDSVGHGEMVVRADNGDMKAFSSYMEYGVVIHNLHAVCKARIKNGHYIVMRLKQPVTEEQIKAAWTMAQAMKRQNETWCKAAAQERREFIDFVWPKRLRAWLWSKLEPTGYDWPGLIIGTRAMYKWTCIGACLELYKRLGIRTNSYGTGFLGIGTGLLNPIMPVRFLSDPAFELLTVEHKKAFAANT